MTLAIIGLGSSMGPRVRNLRLATRILGAHPAVTLVATSRIWRTPPMGGVARGAFANAAVSIETTLPPRALLVWCKAIEARVGRRPTVRWADRVIDLDILMYGSHAVEEDGLVIPHPQLLARDFALRPAQEVAPALIHPQAGQSLSELGVEGRGMCAVGVLGRVGLARRRGVQ